MISTHVLDTSRGLPAAKIKVVLEDFHHNDWSLIDQGETNQDGRIVFKCNAKSGQYRLRFFVSEYFKSNGTEAFFEMIPVEFKVVDVQRKYHIPLLLNPFGYSTYRGS